MTCENLLIHETDTNLQKANLFMTSEPQGQPHCYGIAASESQAVYGRRVFTAPDIGVARLKRRAARKDIAKTACSFIGDSKRVPTGASEDWVSTVRRMPTEILNDLLMTTLALNPSCAGRPGTLLDRASF